ncbi:MAG: MBL fold metallo-hydrolase, partial [Armatimonadetes bacterium]|nr:MBL fold metallo-hydrolase [Armatimonadota bacterium]
MVTPQRESILVDCGWPRADDRDAQRIEHVARYVVGLDRIDHFVATHWHTDHYGGIEG